jgi:hypothetical protein
MVRITDKRMRLGCHIVTGSAILLALLKPAYAGPPYVSDDPEPTEYGHYEIFTYTHGAATRGGTAGVSGIDFNYGATPDLQLTFDVPLAYDSPVQQNTTTGIGNVEIAAKYRFLHQSQIDWDVAFFPRLFLPSGSKAVGEGHASLLLPIWLERNWDEWSTFGGGGYVINRGGMSQDFCIAGWVLTRQVLPNLQLGVEVYHQTADTRGGGASSGLGGGLLYDVNDNYHLLASVGPGIQNVAETNRMSWYVAMLFTY